MKGFSRHKVIDFDTYNNDAFVRIQAISPDSTMTEYTNSFPDIDSEYCWACEDPIFTDLMTSDDLATVLSEEDAIAGGMVK